MPITHLNGPGLNGESNLKFSGRQVAQNASRSLIGQLLPILVAVISIPMLIHRLGTERFGVLTLAWTFMGYFNLFDLGLGRTLTKNIAERLGSDQEGDVPALFWTTVAATAALGIIGGVTLGGLSPWLVTHVFRIPDALSTETLNSLLIISACIPFVITTVPFRGVLEATQDFLTINRIQIPIGALFYLSPLIFSFFSTSLPFVVFALVLCRFFSWLFFLKAAVRALPGTNRQIQIRLSLLPGLLRFGGWITIANIVKPILNYADRFMIDMMISISAVAYYATPYEITNRMWILPWAIMSAVFPAFAYQARTSPERAGVMFTRAFKFIFALLFPVALFILLFSKETLMVWVGPEYASHSSQVFQILAFATLLNCLSLAPEALLEASGYPQIPGLLHLVQLPLYIAALYFVLPRYGLIGAGAVWVIHTAMDTLVLSYFSKRLMKTIHVHWPIVLQLCVLISATFALFYFVPFALFIRGIFALCFCFIYPHLIWTRFFTAEERGFVIELLVQKYRVSGGGKIMRENRIQNVGIAMAVYKPKIEFLRQQLESIVQQSFRNWVCVITADSSLEELRSTSLSTYFEDPRFVWFQNEKQLGFKSNFERAVQKVSRLNVDAIALADQDDVWYPHKLERLVSELNKLPLGSLVHSDMDLLYESEEDGKATGQAPQTAWQSEPRIVTDNMFVQLLLNNVVTGAACLFDVELARQYGNIPEAIEFHDQWFAIAASLNGEIGAIHESLYAYRQHENNLVGSHGYDGMFKLPRKVKLPEILRSAVGGWHKIVLRFYAVRESGLARQIPSAALSFMDTSVKGGTKFIVLSYLYAKDNPVLAREYFRKGIGKLFSPSTCRSKPDVSSIQRINRVGIALATYKPDPEFFFQQLNSIQKQTFANWFCVIGCDSDITELKSTERFRPFVEDQRFSWFQHAETKGAKKNFEFTIQECVRLGCDVIACSDQDDVWYANKLEISCAALAGCPALSLVHSDMHILLSDGATVEHYNDQHVRKLIESESSTVWVQERRGIQNVNPAHFLIRNVVAGAGMLMDSRLAQLYPQIPDEIPYHDYWYAIVAAAHGGVYPIPRALYQYRIHGKNLAGVTPFRGVFSYSESIRQRGLLRKVADSYRFSKGNMAAAMREQIFLGRMNQLVIGSRLDLGFGYLIWGLQHLKDDPAFARACFARAVGKWASIIV